MHIPPYHKRKSWQRFLVGTFFGGLIAYCILIYMYGSMYEQLLEQNLELQSQVDDLKDENNALLKDKEDLSQQTKESDTVKKIEIRIDNEKEVKMDTLIVHQLEKLIKKEISHIVGQDKDIVSDSERLLESTIENKSFRIDEMTYQFTVIKTSITDTVKLTLEAEIVG
ncbi:sporulation membrane protein YtrI [Virgibacillus sp. DJP39]|uniref:sporulation membrane protein YtrI n=1 Tax=Virgibacillus sp. DJP39 TaxID=3409790 RepID=UPI003BB785D2